MSSRAQVASTSDHATLISADRPVADGVIRVLTLNRPTRRNALDTALAQSLESELRSIDGEGEVRAVVLSGHGPGFCAGGDLKEFRGVPDARSAVLARAQLFSRIFALIPAMPVPVVCAVHGSALGAGAALVLASDMAIAAEGMTLGYPELQDGMVPSLVMTEPVHQLRPKIAFELLTMPKRLTASEALACGLVNAVTAPDDVVAAAVEVAERWAALDRHALREVKRVFYRLADLHPREARQVGLDVTAATYGRR